MSLRELLDQATPGPWELRIAAEVRRRNVRAANGLYVAVDAEQDDARLIALCPETTALLVDMADALETGGNFPALLDRFRALEQKAAGGEA